jgi:pre-mRNA-splicing factor 18
VRRKQQESAAERPKRAQPHAPAQDTGTPANHTPEGLSREEVIRRLRVLKEPATLFGERDDDRYKRLVAAESNIQVEDEAAGGQQANLHIAIEREEKTRWRQQRLLVEERAKAAAQAANAAEEAGSTQGSELATLDPEALKVGEAFKRAAEALAEQNMAVEDRISKWLRIWLQDWEADLEARSTEVKSSAAGRQADLRFKETEQYMRPLFSRLKNRSLVKEMLAGIKMIVDCMKDRNYLHAYKASGI